MAVVVRGIHKVSYPVVRQAVLAVWREAAVSQRLPASSWLILEEIAHLVWWHARHSDRHAPYAVPSERWIGGRVSRRREAVSVQVQALAAAGLLQVQPRRKVCGRWQTNMYHLGGAILGRLLGVVRRLKPAPRPEAVISTGQSPSYVCGRPHTVANTGKSAEFRSLVERWLGRGGDNA